MQGKAIIFSAPSGAGKTTIVNELLKTFPQLKFSISATTRSRRDAEVDGVHYYFLTIDDFKRRIAAGDFLEWEEVYDGMFYGTLKSEIDRIWSQGNHVIFDVDVKGGMNLKKVFGEKALSIFVKVPDIEILAERLEERNTENKESLRKRVDKASKEMKYEVEFDEVVLNDDLQKSLKDAGDLVNDFIVR